MGMQTCGTGDAGAVPRAITLSLTATHNISRNGYDHPSVDVLLNDSVNKSQYNRASLLFSSQAPPSITGFGFQYSPPQLLPVSGHCTPISYSHYLQIIFNFIGPSSVAFLFSLFIPFWQSLLIGHSFVIHPCNMSIPH